MARIDVVICDSCGGRIERPQKPDLCTSCAPGGEVDLRGVPYREWPALLTRESVKLILEARDKTEHGLREKIKAAERGQAEAEREAERQRIRAANGYGEPDMAKALADICVASGSNRVEAGR